MLKIWSFYRFFSQKARLCFPGLQWDRWCTRWGWPAHRLCTGTWSKENNHRSRSNKVICCLEKVLSSWEAANSPCRIYPSYSQFQPTPLFCSSSRHQSPYSIFSLLVCKHLNVLSPAAHYSYSSVDVYRVFTILLTNRDYSLQIHCVSIK